MKSIYYNPQSPATKVTTALLEQESVKLLATVRELGVTHTSAEIARELAVKHVYSIYTQTAAFKALYKAFFALAEVARGEGGVPGVAAAPAPERAC